MGVGRALAPGPGARDLAAYPGGTRRTGTGPMAFAPGAPPQRAEEPHPRQPARVRPPLPGVGPVRRRRPGTPAPAGAARTLGGRHRRRLTGEPGSSASPAAHGAAGSSRIQVVVLAAARLRPLHLDPLVTGSDAYSPEKPPRPRKHDHQALAPAPVFIESGRGSRSGRRG